MMMYLVGIGQTIDFHSQIIALLMPVLGMLLSHDAQKMQKQVVAGAHVEHGQHDYSTRGRMASLYTRSHLVHERQYCAQTLPVVSRDDHRQSSART